MTLPASLVFVLRLSLCAPSCSLSPLSHLLIIAAPYSISLKPPGDCFAKCRDVPWFLMTREQQTHKNFMPVTSCRHAKNIGCTVPGGQQVGFIDYNHHNRTWRAC